MAATPIIFAHQYNRNWLHFSGLNECQYLEQFVECAVAARKRDQRLGAEQEMQFAHGKIVKAETEFGRNVGVRILLVR